LNKSVFNFAEIAVQYLQKNPNPVPPLPIPTAVAIANFNLIQQQQALNSFVVNNNDFLRKNSDKTFGPAVTDLQTALSNLNAMNNDPKILVEIADKVAILEQKLDKMSKSDPAKGELRHYLKAIANNPNISPKMPLASALVEILVIQE